MDDAALKQHLTACDARCDPLIFDFDHTLLRGNSTELFLSSARPKAVVSFLDVLLRGLIPWKIFRVSHAHRLRDWSCVVAVMILLPWNLWLWRRKAPGLFREHENRTIGDALSRSAKASSIILTFGTRFIVEAMIRDSDWAQTKLVANPTRARLSHFRMGKLELASAHIEPSRLDEATFVTDSEDDRDLINRTRHGILIYPQGSIVATAHTSYFPLRYTTNVKYPRRYVLDQLFLVDLVILILSCNYAITPWYTALLSVPFLYLSIMCVYEIGYFENDMKAATKEATPTLGAEAAAYRDYPIGEAWIWAAGLSAAGLMIASIFLHWGLSKLVIVLACWAVALVAIRGVFSLYNGLATHRRVHAYLALQLCKYVPIALLLPVSVLGAVILASQSLTMWIHYVVYRSGGRPLYTSKDVIRLITSLAILGFLAATRTLPPALDAATVIYLLWAAFRLYFGRIVIN
jgi:hypothetical protein